MFNLTRQERLILAFLAVALAAGAAVRVFTGRKVPPTPRPVELSWDLTQPKKPVNLNESAPKINVNAAGTTELCEIPGLGIKLAERVVAYRRDHPPLKSADDLARITGIGPATAQKMAPYITFGPAVQ